MGKTDVILDGWAIEVKNNKRPSYGLMVKAVRQAEVNRTKEDDIPIAVIHKVGQLYSDSLVIMRLETFIEFFVNQQVLPELNELIKQENP